MKHKIVTFALSAIGVLTLYTIVSICLANFGVRTPIVYRIYWERRESILIDAAMERQQRLEQIWFMISSYHKNTGEYPKSDQDLQSAFTDFSSLTSPPAMAAHRSYNIDYSVLEMENVKLLISDPGFDWRGPGDIQLFQRSLLNNGAIYDNRTLGDMGIVPGSLSVVRNGPK